LGNEVLDSRTRVYINSPQKFLRSRQTTTTPLSTTSTAFKEHQQRLPAIAAPVYNSFIHGPNQLIFSFICPTALSRYFLFARHFCSHDINMTSDDWSPSRPEHVPSGSTSVHSCWKSPPSSRVLHPPFNRDAFFVAQVLLRCMVSKATALDVL
jgi:hypothetical protein